MNTAPLLRVALFGFVITQLWAQDPLDSWGRRVVPGLNVNLHAVAFGNGVFVAVGDQSTVASSSDGLDWVVITPGAYGDFARVRFLNGQFFVVGSSDKMLVSTNGTTWTAQMLPSTNFWDIAAGNGVYVLAGALTYVSTNGMDWVRTYPMLPRPFGFPPYETALDSIAFGDNVFLALATGGPAPGTLTRRPSIRSTNGVDWISTPALSPATRTENSGDILFANGLFVAASCNCPDSDSYRGVSLSTNYGASWCCAFNPFGLSPGGGALAYGQGNYLWAWQDNSARPSIWTSTNGASWVLRYTDETRMPYAGAGAAFGHGTFVVVGPEGFIVQSGNLGGAPLILVQPQDRGAVAGNPASFSVLSSGEPPLAYQWFHNDTTIAAATNSAYTIPSVTASNTGGYTVVITNSFGSVTSRVAQLSISFLDIKSYAGIEILGLIGRTYRIDATAVNGPVNWQTLTNLVLPSTPFIWIDYESPTVGQRLYRAAELPP